MREILFRGKRTDGAGWIYGDLLHPLNPETQGHYIVPVGSALHRMTEVASSTVGQFTGLTDKNGKRIFEGDIVKTTALLNDHHQRGATFVSPVEYWNGATCLSITYVPLSLGFLVSHEIEVIGNIHDNPDLLKIKGDAV